ncbi:MAG: DUF58 domain-containing protein [Actinomycetota bacterium]
MAWRSRDRVAWSEVLPLASNAPSITGDGMFDAQQVALSGDRDFRERTSLFNVSFGFAVATFVIAIVIRRPDVIALGVPFAIIVGLALTGWKPVQGEVRVGVDSPHIREGDLFRLLVDIDAPTHRLDRVEVELELSDRIEAESTVRAVTPVDGGTTRRIAFPIHATQWGVARVPRIHVRVTERFGLFGGSVSRPLNLSIRIGMPEERSSATVEAERFRRVVGSHLSGDRGQGLEIADIRPYLPGDSARDINWRISNRRREPWITLRHPDRSATVVVVVDAHEAANEGHVEAQRRSVSAALALARGHLATQDPVGLLVVGHSVRWLPPRLGRNQLYRIADELISVSNVPRASLRMYRPPAVSNIGRETIVVAISPLRDPLMVGLIAELRSRGNPVAVLVPTTDNDVRFGVERPTTAMARRLAVIEQTAGLHSLRSRGVVVIEWGDEEPVTVVLEAITRLRRSMRKVAG